MFNKNLAAQTFFFLGSVVLIGFLLYIGRSFLQPFVIAVIFWYLIVSLTQTFGAKYKNYQLPEPAALGLAIITCAVCVVLVSSIVSENVEQINDKIPEYQANVITLTESALQTYAPKSNLDAQTFIEEKIFGAINFGGLASDTARTVGALAGKFVLICIYVLFLLLEHKMFPQKLKRITEKGASYAKTVNILQDISQDLNTYFKIKTIASMATAVLSYLVMIAFGVDFAAFWALLIFLLNYIPTVGSPIATAFPVFITLLQFSGGYQFIAVGIILTAVQVMIGSILEPRYQGNTLNISPLVIIVSLAFWASIWGVLGALLCIPITAIINIMLSKFESTQWISLLISADGRGKGYKDFKWHKQLHKQVRKQVKKLKS